MSTTSQIPAFITGLYNAAFGALSATTTVIDGPPLSWDPVVVPGIGAVNESAFLFIGARPGEDLSATAVQERTTTGSGRSEAIDVTCTALARADELSLPTTRLAAFGIVGVLEQAIRADQTFGGAVAWAVLSAVDEVEQTQKDDGAYCIVLFTVTGKAFLR